ncbi:MAG: hypothetical protein GX297_10050 [Treponema sp.]|jgi:Na+-transporting methylmalonyl-CoA/oxaloacetate decarboxylase gamma subunit|nr:hypothetical protein [Treponema sp.]
MNFDILPQTVTLLVVGMIVLFVFMGALFVLIHLFVALGRKFSKKKA